MRPPAPVGDRLDGALLCRDVNMGIRTVYSLGRQCEIPISCSLGHSVALERYRYPAAELQAAELQPADTLLQLLVPDLP